MIISDQNPQKSVNDKRWNGLIKKGMRASRKDYCRRESKKGARTTALVCRGHKSSIMTQRYAHHYPEILRKGVEMLELY
jgi:hypothetical protein